MSFEKISVPSVREQFVRDIENKILSGELEPTSGSVALDPKKRMSVLKQNQSLYDGYSLLDTVIMGAQYNGYLQRLVESSRDLKDWLGTGDRTVAACMLLGYPAVRYWRTAPRKSAQVIEK